MIRFGPAGNSNHFKEQGYKTSDKAPKYLSDLNLNAYEYQCSRGVRINEKTFSIIKEECEKYDIDISVHSPYFVSLTTPDETKQLNTIKYITDSMIAVKLLGGTRVVIHCGGLLGMTREEALSNACKLIKRAREEADKLGFQNIIICPETMGKINQLGNSKEVIELCKTDSRNIPTIDFGHLYCRSLGKLNNFEAWEKELKLYIDELGYNRMKNFHCHYSRQIYTENGGEKEHTIFDDLEYGPDFVVIAKVLKKLKLCPTIICESRGTQSLDSLKLREIYENV